MADGLNALTDEAGLIQRALRGELEAFNVLVRQHQNSVYTLAYRIMGEPQAAADVAQDAFIAAYRKLTTYRGGSFRGWLLRITTNLCYDELRRRKRRPAQSFEDLPEAESADGPALPDPAETPEQIVQRGELNTAIQDCINGLNEDQRVVLVLSDVQGYSYDEIASMIATPQGTVKSRLSRARLNVRRCLQAVQELLPAAYRLLNVD